ncbi:MAG: hypothetical protein JRG81_06215 [Deltaproteobacteria bacterium]|nr:hypothetical protein [Deltaproteobacteria bacterium]
MTEEFQPNCYPLLIGSLPLGDHKEALRLVFTYTPDIPLWVQLPVYKEEAMINQFLPGLPGLKFEKGEFYIDNKSESFDKELLEFYEEYLDVTEGRTDITDSRFALRTGTATGFFELLKIFQITPDAPEPFALKGQITGPVTFCTGIKDVRNMAIFYDERVRDAATKLLAMKAAYQVRQLSSISRQVIIFIDEPALAGYGSSEFTSISGEEISTCLEDVIEGVHLEGGIAGVHVCANTDWSLVLNSSVDIVNFDAYSYFDRFVLYADDIKRFVNRGGIIAWGIIPTSSADDIEKESVGTLVDKWKNQAGQLEAIIGIDASVVRRQSFITPSCGTGSLSLDLMEKVLKLTKGVSEVLRNEL